MLIRLVCDGGGPLGLGNLRRSTTLALALKACGHRVRVETASPQAQALLPAEAPADVGTADLILLDIPYAAHHLVAEARSQSLPIAALDYEGDAPPDLTISLWSRGTAPVGGREAAGLEYAIIRDDVASLAPARAGSGVLIVMGGGDADGLGERAARQLAEAGQQVTLIDGPLAQPTMNLPPEVVRVRVPEDLARRMAACSWAVTSGGSCMLEMLCLGKPTHVLPRTHFERGFADLVAERGALLGLGLETLRPPVAAQAAVAAETGRRLIDGRGCSRIAALLEDLVG